MRACVCARVRAYVVHASVRAPVPALRAPSISYETAYGSAAGGDAVAFVLPSGVALACGWHGDNVGPPPVADVQADWDSLEQLFPGAAVISSPRGLDPFFEEANRPEVKALLPVVTADIGDGWVYGVPSDPLKVAQFREAARQRSACLAAAAAFDNNNEEEDEEAEREEEEEQRTKPTATTTAAVAAKQNKKEEAAPPVAKCNASSPGMRRFDRLLGKVAEHTWGVAMHVFLPDYANWSNTQFDGARAALQPAGFQ
jgi:hypothetical protein